MDVTFVSPSNHEEADTRVFLHAKDMAHHGHTKIAIRTVDTDVLVLAISAFSHLEDMVEELWVDFGTGKNRSFFPVHQIYNDGKSKVKGLPSMHSLVVYPSSPMLLRNPLEMYGNYFKRSIQYT